MNNKKQNKKRKYLLQIPKPSHNVKLISRIFLLALAFVGGLIFFTRIVIPWVLQIVYLLLDLFRLYYTSSDKYITFFGGIFFFIISYKIFDFVASIWVKGMGIIIKEFRK